MMRRDPYPAERLVLIGTRQHVLEVAFDVARKNAATLSVREFDRNVLERLGNEEGDLLSIELRAISPEATPASTPGEGLIPAIDTLVGRNLADVEQALILSTLIHCQGNRTSAATMLGISVRTIRNKLRTFLEDGVPVMPAQILSGSTGAPRKN